MTSEADRPDDATELQDTAEEQTEELSFEVVQDALAAADGLAFVDAYRRICKQVALYRNSVIESDRAVKDYERWVQINWAEDIATGSNDRKRKDLYERFLHTEEIEPGVPRYVRLQQEQQDYRRELNNLEMLQRFAERCSDITFRRLNDARPVTFDNPFTDAEGPVEE